MQMGIFTITATVAALATAAVAAPTAESSQDLFHVTGFLTLCTKSFPPTCISHFNLSLDSNPSVECSTRWNETDYVLCGAAGPGQTYSAFIEKLGDQEGGPGNLRAKSSQLASNGNVHNDFGNATLPQPEPDFDFPVVAGSIEVPTSDA